MRDRGNQAYDLMMDKDAKGHHHPVALLSLTRQAKKASGLSGRQWTRYRRDRQRQMAAAARANAAAEQTLAKQAVEAAGAAAVAPESVE